MVFVAVGNKKKLAGGTTADRCTPTTGIQHKHNQTTNLWREIQEVTQTQPTTTGQGRPRSPKMVQSAEGGNGKDKSQRIIVVVKSPYQENDR